MTPEHLPSDQEPVSQNERYYSAATNWVAKEDLLSSRPDLMAQIEAESESDLVDYVAERVGDALQEMYWDAVNQALKQYFNVPDSDPDEDRGEPL